MMSMADGGGSAAGQQVLINLIILECCDVSRVFADNHLIPGGLGCELVTL